MQQDDGSRSFSTRLGHSFRGFLFGGEGGGSLREGRAAAAAAPGQLSRAESNTTGIDIWRADGEDFYAAAAANANGMARHSFIITKLRSAIFLGFNQGI